MKVTRITATEAYTDGAIYANRGETKVVSETDPEVDHLVTPANRLFPFEKAVNLGLLKADDPINTEAALEHTVKPEGKKVIEQPEADKAIKVGTANRKDKTSE